MILAMRIQEFRECKSLVEASRRSEEAVPVADLSASPFGRTSFFLSGSAGEVHENAVSRPQSMLRALLLPSVQSGVVFS